MRLTGLFVVLSVISYVKTDVPDITVLYRYTQPQVPSEESFSVEVRSRTNALGRVLMMSNGTFHEPAVVMPALSCAEASSCSWSKTGTWSFTNETLDKVLPFILRAEDEGEFVIDCRILAICQGFCNEENGLCTCQPSLNETVSFTDGHTSSRKCVEWDLMTALSGKWSHDVGNGSRTWLISVPYQYNIKLNISFISIHDYNTLEVFDVDLSDSLHLLRKHDTFSTFVESYSSSSNKMLIVYESKLKQYYGRRRTFSAEYSTKLKRIPVLTMSGNTGSMESLLVVPRSSALCVQVIHNKPSNRSNKEFIWISGATTGQKFTLVKKELYRSGTWRISRFVETATGVVDHPLKLTVHLQGAGSQIFSIVGCNPYDDEDLFVFKDSTLQNSSIPATNNQIEVKSGQLLVCYNGGVWSALTGDCHCPAGFHGKYCEEGCGPNSFGNDCHGICSNFKTECQGIIFCRQNLPCLCAPGYRGERCNESCPDGYYGAGCRQPCRQCSGANCDRYTGKCPMGCISGFFPPLCEGVYKYLAAAPDVITIMTHVASFKIDFSNTIGLGAPKLYQLQYKEKESALWYELELHELDTEIATMNVTSLLAGVEYQARVVIINEDGGSYQGSKVPITEFATLCSIPSSKEYNLKAANVTKDSFTISWKYGYPHTLHELCPLTGFEITLHHKWQPLLNYLPPTDSYYTYIDLLPGRKYNVKLQGVTRIGKAPVSSLFTVATEDDVPGEVSKLKVTDVNPTFLTVTWDPPNTWSGIINYYKLEYKCLRLLACSDDCQHLSRTLNVTENNMKVYGLLPFALYEIRVAAVTVSEGPFTSLTISTNHTRSVVAPSASPLPVKECFNTSFTVQWKYPRKCFGMNGFLLEYYVELYASSNMEEVLQNKRTKNTNMKFEELTPRTDYQVRVHVKTTGNLISEKYLVVNVSTHATTPEAVQNLTVYKRARRMIGIKWAAPQTSYGILESFSVTHHKIGGKSENEMNEVVELMHCPAWPNLFCHTITENLLPNVQYLITVQAKNSEVKEFGAKASVTAVTQEGVSEPPTDLKVINSTQTSVLLEWCIPNIINGILRSFVVTVEEIDTADSSYCCKKFPIQEVAAQKEEQNTYHFEVTDIRPASTLGISVSAKTVSLSPSATIAVIVPPVAVPLMHPPLVKIGEDHEISVYLQNNEEKYTGIDSTYLLLILPPDNEVDLVLWDDQVLEKLQAVVNQSFYLAAEFQSGNALPESTCIGSGVEVTDGIIGQIQDPVLNFGEYRVGLALIMDYAGAKAVSFVASEPFQVS